MTEEEERWAEAMTVYRQHGDGARVHVASRIGACAMTGDQAGIKRWTEIAAKLDEIMRAGEQ